MITRVWFSLLTLTIMALRMLFLTAFFENSPSSGTSWKQFKLTKAFKSSQFSCWVLECDVKCKSNDFIKHFVNLKNDKSKLCLQFSSIRNSREKEAGKNEGIINMVAIDKFRENETGWKRWSFLLYCRKSRLAFELLQDVDNPHWRHWRWSKWGKK